jgi:formylglycine-generating enzyme required for sulfatase activity
MRRVLMCAVVLAALCSGAFAAETALSKSLAKPTLLDNSVMIAIPAGVFIMGSNTGDTEEKPVHKVYLDAYEIGRYEVTVAQYRAFCTATGRQMPKAPSWGWRDDHPIVNVTWSDAEAFCEWAGGRLPTEAEWEKAARGTHARVYPWGDVWDRSMCANGELDLKSTAPVGSSPRGASPYGCLDMAGNVWEWCADWYGPDYYKTSPARNPTGPDSGEYRIMRGGCFYSYEGGTRCTYRGNYFPSGSWYSGGFRMAR